MTRSMTAFARQQSEHSWGTLIWEIRSVNHRYLEPMLRLPESFRELEGGLRETLRKRLQRGKVDCTLRFSPSERTDAQLSVNLELATQLRDAAQQVTNLLADPAPLDPLDVLRWPGVLAETQVDMKAVQKEALTLFDQAIAELIENRQREGLELEQLVNQRLDAISEVVIQVRAKLPEILTKQRENILNRLEEAKVELDPNRVEQELVLLAQKADVDEELDRLDTHVTEVQRVLKQKGPVGRRLDFLMQELNREANTLSSKSIVAETTQCAVELKVLIEQMREQIQNIE
ncbi:YicC/YloC family endoribonuclease [Motiliproteus sp. MSK22-1]|uniref:YicC/YloC family endoribonuclease n=1 Tax=Motiliproteus sp. MSK22-1 TaxID=1897630 RepID=UPI0009788334|nr:YicC/YloC family endoribonuclease [Motiliproteus sp. MSK22-1]OMH28092.1 YicC family protein [Motiliproteus sp. MSK22-1]